MAIQIKDFYLDNIVIDYKKKLYKVVKEAKKNIPKTL